MEILLQKKRMTNKGKPRLKTPPGLTGVSIWTKGKSDVSGFSVWNSEKHKTLPMMLCIRIKQHIRSGLLACNQNNHAEYMMCILVPMPLQKSRNNHFPLNACHMCLHLLQNPGKSFLLQAPSRNTPQRPIAKKLELWLLLG